LRRQSDDVTAFQNPVFLTQKRLVHRAGILAPVLISALFGLSLVAALIYSVVAPAAFPAFSAREVGKLLYGWLIGLQTLVLVVGGFSRIARVLADDRKAGLWDSNRLTPMKPSEVVAGYWLGAGLREFYMSAVLTAIGLLLVGLARLPFTLWLGSQALLFSTALLFGLIAVATGMGAQRPQGGLLFLLIFIFAQLLSFFQPRFMLTNFLVPIYAIQNLFSAEAEWSQWPEFFGLPVHPIPYSLCLQWVVGCFLWRALVSKTANPSQPLLRRRKAVALFAVLIVAQHGLTWGLWRGEFQVQPGLSIREPMLAYVHAATLLAGALVLALTSPSPERLRVEALQEGFRDCRTVFARSAIAPGLALAAIAAAALLSQCFRSLSTSWLPCLVAGGNLLAFFAIFPLLLEFCRLRFERRAPGFFILGLFVLGLLPFMLAAAFSQSAIGRWSLLSPGILALSQPLNHLPALSLATAGHLLIALLIFLLWRNRWRRLLSRLSAEGGPRNTQDGGGDQDLC
jgi:hypothetical protein